ncbi:transglycosylase SLT domain-containing protein [Nonomuraea glycinis]|uniref:transglycosylase SLT domain-containing protein n=1 Tax=Nonomuraea glycinis TaxID=2047744 RepID=UPI002E0E01CE|nr:transglycosylase SLT domain-containing protein [Nonomuraea glycinis]
MSVSHLPGGEKLDAMLKKVTGDPDKINGIATTWRNLSGEIHEFAEALTAAVAGVDKAWQGRSADQFDTYMRKYGTAAEHLKVALINSATGLDTAATALRSAKTDIATICRDLAGSATNYRTKFLAGDPDATEEDLRPGLRKLVDQAVKEAQPHVDAADKAVTKAKKDLKQFLDDRELTFRAIPAVSTQQFTPAKGRKLDWEPDPDYQQRDRTSPSGGSGGPTSGTSASGYGYGPSGPPPSGGRPAPTGQVKEWIDQAMEILRQHGVPDSKMNPADIAAIILHESGNNPNAINEWDSNAAAGTPSKGLMQTIDPTFNAYRLPGPGDIYDPVQNIIAGVRYAISRYGSVSNVPGLNNGDGGYIGY